MTEMRLAEKRKERTLAQRAKRKAKIRRLIQTKDAEVKQRYSHNKWLAEMGRAHQEGAQISRRSNSTMPGYPKKGLLSRIKSFFRRRSNVTGALILAVLVGSGCAKKQESGITITEWEERAGMDPVVAELQRRVENMESRERDREREAVIGKMAKEFKLECQTSFVYYRGPCFIISKKDAVSAFRICGDIDELSAGLD